MEQASASSVRALVETIRQQFPTICYELAMPTAAFQLAVKTTIRSNGFGTTRGEFQRIGDVLAVTMWPVGDAVEQTFTLAHECRHAFQDVHGLPFVERDADDFATYFAGKYHGAIVVPPYAGRIAGEVVRCRCDRAWITNETVACSHCRNEEVAGAQARQLAATQRDLRRQKDRDGAEATRKAKREGSRAKSTFWRSLSAMKSIFQRPPTLLEYTSWIDKHPDNGRAGYWLVDDRAYVWASTAGEAIIAAAGLIESEMPDARFIGDTVG